MCWQESEKYIYVGKNSKERGPAWGQPPGKPLRGRELRAPSGLSEVTSAAPRAPTPNTLQRGALGVGSQEISGQVTFIPQGLGPLGLGG